MFNGLEDFIDDENYIESSNHFKKPATIKK